MPNLGSSPLYAPLPALQEDQQDLENLSSRLSESGSAVGSQVGGSVVGSVSQLSDSKISLSQRSGCKSGQFSAFTAPPRYRNSGAFVHGTKYRNFNSIMKQGLKAAKSEIFMIDEVRADGRVPGLKEAPEILIIVDENKARSENMEFDYDAKEGTWKTRGIDGVIRPWFFQKVVDQRKGPGRGNVLFQSREDPLMQANKLPLRQKPKYLLHATYWENVSGIMRQGILPAKNPTSESRRPFKTLLQGAESHVYTVRPSPGLPDLEQAVASSSGALSRLLSTQSEPEALPEHEPPVHYLLEKDQVGLERRPDAIFVIDTAKAEQMGFDLDLVQSGEREETIFVQGTIPTDILAAVKPNDPVNLPESLKASIVDPKSFEDIPIIDLRSDEATLLKQLRYACEDVGFMQIVGHGVSEDLQQRHMDLQQRFFQLPKEVKERLKLNEESPVRGYFGLGGEDLDQVVETQVDQANGKDVIRKSRKDMKEALDTNGVEWAKPVGGYIAEIFGQPSQLPEEEELAGFREVLREYAAEMFRVAKRLLEIMALILEKPRDFFEQYLTNPVATHRLLHYWPLKDFNTEIGVGEHTDYGLLTILKQDMVGGLQVLNAKDGRWIHCCPVENAFVVNLGDMISRWTAHRFKSTVHRVVTTSVKERYSVPYFLEPNMDTVVKYGGLCDGPGLKGSSEMSLAASSSKPERAEESQRFQPPPRQVEPQFAEDTAEAILERFYRASGQLRFGPKKKEG